MTGIYELDLKGLSAITNLSFDLNTIRTIANNPTGYLLIDVIYEGV